jgi:hypothetical protein
MDSCDDCLKFENRFRRARGHYLNLISQQMNGNGNSEGIALEHAIRQARRRRNAAGRLFLDHWIGHYVLSRPKTRTAGTE